MPPPMAKLAETVSGARVKPKSYLKLIKKYLFSEGEQFPLKLGGRGRGTRTGEWHPDGDLAIAQEPFAIES